jgi:hypothetical protein
MNTEANGISIQTMCYQCQALNELCPDCQELRDSRDINIAHQIVDEGNLQYKFIWSIQSETISGHDWTEREDEFLPQISLITDRIYDLETSLTVTSSETVCDTCHYLHNKAIACPNCN